MRFRVFLMLPGQAWEYKMKRAFRGKIGQSLLEYALLFAVVSAALITMNVYVQRAMNARLKVVQQEMYESTR